MKTAVDDKGEEATQSIELKQAKAAEEGGVDGAEKSIASTVDHGQDSIKGT
jgi:hypothetical protein